MQQKGIHNLTFERICSIIVFVPDKIIKKGECLYILNNNFKYYTKEIIKLSSIMILGLFIIGIVILIKYKPMYDIKLGNEKIGYLEKLENFDNYIEEIKNNENIAFVELKNQPEFKVKLVNRNTKSSEQKIKEKIQNNLLVEYTSYAITYKNQNVAYLSNMEQAENVISELKNDKGIKDLGILQVYSDNYDEIMAQESVTAVKTISKSIKEQDKKGNKIKLASANSKRITDATNIEDTENKEKKSNSKTDKKIKENVSKKETKIKTNTTNKISSKKSSSKKNTTKSEKTNITTKKLAVNLSKPLSGVITSRYGGRKSPGGIGSTNHKGLDIAAKRGTTIKAAGSGTVKFAGYKGSLGNLIIIDHGNGLQTYYGHCSKLYVKKGQKVEAGEKIAAVGSTGAATGPHLHFEIHIKGTAVNPQNYLY